MRKRPDCHTGTEDVHAELLREGLTRALQKLSGSVTGHLLGKPLSADQIYPEVGWEPSKFHPHFPKWEKMTKEQQHESRMRKRKEESLLQELRNPNKLIRPDINEDAEREIQRRYATGEGAYELSQEFDTSPSMVARIIHRRRLVTE